MDDLPEALLAEIVKWLTSPSDLKSLSLVSKRLYAVEGELRNSMYFGCGIFPAMALIRLCFRYPNLCKVKFHAMPLDDHGLQVFSSCCPSLTDLTLSFCMNVHDLGLGFLVCFKKLKSLRLNTLPAITSSGLLSVAVGCKNLSALHLIGCNEVVGREKWLEYLGRVGSLEELVVSFCEKVSQFDLLKFGPGWMKLQKFEFQIKGLPNRFDPRDPSCVEHCQYRYDFSCESLEDLTLARVSTEKEIGLRCLLRKCKALKNLCLYYVHGLQDNDIVTLSNHCNNLTSISLRLKPEFNEGYVFRTSLTDDSRKALALGCRKLQSFELILCACDEKQQQHSLLSQASWGRLEMKPKRNEKQGAKFR
jgi:F-box/leucine-rich repeat protein 2/20